MRQKRNVQLAASVMGKQNMPASDHMELGVFVGVFNQPLWSRENIYKHCSFALLSRNSAWSLEVPLGSILITLKSCPLESKQDFSWWFPAGSEWNWRFVESLLVWEGGGTPSLAKYSSCINNLSELSFYMQFFCHWGQSLIQLQSIWGTWVFQEVVECLLRFSWRTISAGLWKADPSAWRESLLLWCGL